MTMLEPRTTAPPGQPAAPPAKRPGLHDVAKIAGVSHQTVSRVINDFAGVNADTRARVLAAIDQLEYRRNVAARTLVTRRSGIIGVLAPRTALFGPSSTLIAIEAAARDAGFYVSVASLEERSSSKVLHEAFNHFLAQGVDGLVVIAPGKATVTEAATLAHRLPIVLVSVDTVAGQGIPTTTIDNENGARKATQHLIELGHRDIAHISGPAGSLESDSRTSGWRSALRHAELPSTHLIHGDWSSESGHRAGLQLLTQVMPTAVFAANDQMAIGLIAALRENRVTVPEMVSVVGFDDIAGAPYLSPPLTTMRQDFTELGRTCVATLEGLLHGLPATPAIIEPELVCRSSTSSPYQQVNATLALPMSAAAP